MHTDTELLNYLIAEQVKISCDSRGVYTVHDEWHAYGESDSNPRQAIENAKLGYFALGPATSDPEAVLTPEQRQIIDDAAAILIQRQADERRARELQQIERNVFDAVMELLHSKGIELMPKFATTDTLTGQALIDHETAAIREKLVEAFEDRARYRRALNFVCAEFHLPSEVRKILEIALFNPDAEARYE